MTKRPAEGVAPASLGNGSAFTRPWLSLRWGSPGPDRDQVDRHLPQIGNDARSAVLYVVTAQIQVAVWSQMLGLDIDNPFRSGTVRRVVEGVILYSLEGD